MMSRRGVTVLEYTVLVMALLFALLAMQNTLRRVVSGRWKAAADVFGDGRQYQQGETTIIDR